MFVSRSTKHCAMAVAIAIALGAPPPVPAQQRQPCSTVGTEALPDPIPARFYPHRPGAPFGSSLRYRDAEFMWDSLYTTGLTPAVRATLDRFSRALVETTGTSPVAVDAHNTQAVYDYLNREGRTWSPDYFDLTNGLRIGNRNYPAADYSHVDAYITDWARDRGGMFPSNWQTPDEDSTSGHAHGDVLRLNSVHFGGPARTSPYDTLGTGWTAPGSVAFTGFNHEMAHGLLRSNNVYVGGQMEGELWSAGAEAVGGTRYTDTSELPYTWSLLSWCSSCAAPDLGDPGFSNRFSLSNYQGRTSFMAYLTYNFLNADTNRTLAGMRDDLVYKWVRSGNTSPAGLAAMLSDANCATCAQKAYFRRDGVPMSGVERLAVLHHNWRVANFVNNPNLAERQYGYPSWGGFSPTVNQSSWRAVDGTPKTDIVAIPAILDLVPSAAGRDTTLQGMRTFRGVSQPMALVPYGANYWVIRPTGSLAASNQDLVVRVSPRAFYLQCGLGGSGNYGLRLVASAVAYDRLDGGGEESNLWQFPANAVYSTAVVWTMVDSAAGDIRLVVPSFGATHKSVVVTLTLADGRLPDWAASDVPYEEAMPYRLDVGVANTTGLTQEPFRISTTAPGPADWPAWAPAGDEVAYSEYDPAISPNSQIYRRKLDGSPPQRVFAQAVNQFNPDWSPRGDRVVWSTFPASGQIDLWMADVSTPNGPAWQLTNQPGVSTLAAFQPNGQGIAYIHVRAAPADTAWELRWIGLDGTGDRLVTVFPRPAPNIAPLLPVAPRWTRDGAHLVVCDYVTHRFLRCPAASGPPELVSGPALDFVSFDLPPGNGRITATSTTPLVNAAPEGPWCSLFPVPRAVSGRVALLDTSSATRDTSFRFVAPGMEARNLRWSPDGTRVAYSRLRTGTSDGDVWVGRTTWNRAPVLAASVEANYSIPTCAPFELTLYASDPDGDPLTFEATSLPAGAQLQSGNTVYWPYPVAGTHWFVARALDPQGGVASRVVKLDVQYQEYCGGGGGEDPPPIEGGPHAIRQAESNRMIGSGGAGLTRVANTFLDGVLPGQWQTQTVRLMAPRADEAGQVTTRLVALRPGTLRLDRVRLVVAEHAPGTVAAATEDGVVTGQQIRPGRMATEAGEDLSGSLAGADGDTRHFVAGTTLELEWPAGAAVAGVLLDCARASAADPAAEWGVRLEAWHDGAWRPAGRIHPRSGFDLLAAAHGPADRVRLTFVTDTYVREVAGYTHAAGIPGTVTVVPLSGTDAEAGVERLASADEGTLDLAKGEKVALLFDGPAAREDVLRAFFLELVAAVVNDGASAMSGRGAEEALPVRFALHANRPNPFGGGTTIHFDVPRAGPVRVEVFDAQGRRVATLAEGRFGPGTHAVRWDGTDAGGARVKPGVYLSRMVADGFRAQQRMVLLGR